MSERIQQRAGGYYPNTVEPLLPSDQISNSCIVSKIAEYKSKEQTVFQCCPN
jgi:hypothetical protein